MRSLVFSALFYVNITVRMIVALPTILLPYGFLHGVLRRYASSTLWFLRIVCGTKVEWRGREKLHYLNPVPLHEIYERWIEKYERDRLQALSDLKKNLEEKKKG